jgi:hypothetical protein
MVHSGIYFFNISTIDIEPTKAEVSFKITILHLLSKILIIANFLVN